MSSGRLSEVFHKEYLRTSGTELPMNTTPHCTNGETVNVDSKSDRSTTLVFYESPSLPVPTISSFRVGVPTPLESRFLYIRRRCQVGNVVSLGENGG